MKAPPEALQQPTFISFVLKWINFVESLCQENVPSFPRILLQTETTLVSSKEKQTQYIKQNILAA